MVRMHKLTLGLFLFVVGANAADREARIAARAAERIVPVWERAGFVLRESPVAVVDGVLNLSRRGVEDIGIG